MKYFNINNVLDQKMLDQFFEFINANEDHDWTIAIFSTGGMGVVASTMTDIINSRSERVTLISNESYSAAFDLFYNSKCKKKISTGGKGMMHLVKTEMYMMGNGKPAYFEDQAILKGWRESSRDNKYAKKILTDKEYKKFKKGDDVYFTFKRMKQIFPSAEII